MKKRTLLKSLMAVALICASVSFAAEGIAVRGNKTSKIYHKPTCKHYAAKGSTEEFKSEAAAIEAGYKLCKRCSAPKAEKKTEKKTEKKADAPKEK